VKGGPKRKPGRPKTTSDVPISGGPALDRDSKIVALYFQLAVALTEKLEAGSWPPGSRFATEREIEEEYGVSRSVVRHALDLMVGDGAIKRVKGEGTFVKAPRHLVVAAGVLRTLLEPTGVLLDILIAREEQAAPALSRLLEMRGPAPVAHVTAVLRLAGESMGLLDSYSVIARTPGLLAAITAMRNGVRPSKLPTLELTRASAPTELTHFGEWGAARIGGVSAGDPAFKATLLQFGRARGRVREHLLELAHIVYRTDSVKLG
jgi:DNA-binding GntR family transcriptional regulator